MKKSHILILDDVKDNIYSLKLLIEDNFECVIYEATSAMEGINIIVNNNIDLVFCDIQMPEIDGFEFLDYLKSLRSTEKIPVVLVSGVTLSKNTIDRISNCKAEEFLAKPIDCNSLTSLINNVLSKQKLIFSNNEVLLKNAM